MKIYMLTTNRHKLEEAISVLKEYDVEVDQIKDEKYEPKDMDLVRVAEYNARFFNEKYKKPVVVDDTGVFFKAYPDFPGSHPKLIFEMIGYKGILKLLEGENREAEFRSVVSFCNGNILKSFSGSLMCMTDTKVNDPDKDVLAYERIFLVNAMPISSFSREEKNKISHRAQAFRKLGEWLKNPDFFR